MLSDFINIVNITFYQSDLAEYGKKVVMSGKNINTEQEILYFVLYYNKIIIIYL